jgi:curved DNA-binding protein CbpA
MANMDYYEFLQISRNADPDTIHRVYRFLAARLHPDNPETGNPDKFMLLQQAWDVLSDPKRRAEYDASFQTEGSQQAPLSKTLDFMDDIEGELNRRLALLALLYIQRRARPYNPEISLSTVEKQMGVPREYLQFTTWYLHNKKYITRSDSSELTLTVAGVDFVEANRANMPVLDKLLTNGAGPAPRP